ncbi:hypothetical protein Tco_0993479 [Tanacetum coccineum]
MNENKSFNRNPANHALYHALVEALIENENAMDKGVADTVKNHKRQHDDGENDDEDPSARPNQGKSATTPEPIEEPIAYVVMADLETTANEDVVNDVDRSPGHLTVVVEYFFNNDLEFLKSSDPEKKYTTSITNTKATRYEIVGIEDMVPTLWSPIKYGYNKDVEKGIKHWGDRPQLCVSVKKLHGYGHLEEIVVKRADRQLYKFKEGDFVDLHLNDIEDMLLLAVQHKLFHLNDSDIVDFIVALRMFTRSLIIKRRVEDLQLGVESYQKKLNITAPQKTFPEIEFKELYTPSYKPPGVIYEDLNKQKRVMRADELYKFSDGTLKTVRDELHHRILDFHLGYNKEMSRRKWTATDKNRPELMVELIDKQMRERQIIKNLERLVGARELEMDYKLMTRTV